MAADPDAMGRPMLRIGAEPEVAEDTALGGSGAGRSGAGRSGAEASMDSAIAGVAGVFAASCAPGNSAPLWRAGDGDAQAAKHNEIQRRLTMKPRSTA